MTDEKQREIFANNLSYYVANSGKQQKDIAKALGFNQKTFNGWCNGLSMPTMGKIQALADYFSIGKSDLVDERVISKTAVTSYRIPVLGRVAAGLPIEAQQEILDWEEISGEMALDGEYFALQIKGDSMEPRMRNGDVVIVRQQEDADDGDTVIALVDGCDAVCKRLKKYQDGIALVSTNPAYEPMYFSGNEIDITPVKIIGRVMELRAKF